MLNARLAAADKRIDTWRITFGFIVRLPINEEWLLLTKQQPLFGKLLSFSVNRLSVLSQCSRSSGHKGLLL
jgi:hypothetical protein